MSCYKCKYYNWEEPQEVVWSDLNGQEYCVFHAPTDHKGVSEADFVALVTKHLEMAINQNYLVCNLAGTIFCGPINFPDQILPKLDLRDTSFEGRVLFKGCNFDLLNLNDASFEDRVAFIDCDFNGRVAFGGCTFVSDVSFDGSSFLKGAAFISTKFMGDAYFNETRFLNGLWFTDVLFFGKVCFVDSEFAYGRFWKVIADAPVIFRYCRYTAENYIDFVDIDLFWFDFLSTNLENIRFTGCCWPIDNERYCIQHERENVQLPEVLDFYRRMKRKCKMEHNEYEASKWHIAEKEVQAKLLANDRGSKFIRLMLWLYRKFSHFGESPLRAFRWLLIFISFVWLLLGMFGIENGSVIIQGVGMPTWDNISNFGTVFITLFKNVMLFKLSSIEFHAQYGTVDGIVLIFTRLVIPLQATLFAFALRNRFRR